MDSTSGKILRRLLREGRVSRAELAEGLGISRAAVSAVTDHLMGEGLIRVSGIGESRGGKPPVMLSIEPDAFHVIGLDIGSGTLLRGLRWNAAGETVQQVELPFRNTFEEILEKSAHLIQKLVGRDSCVRVAGICAAVSGIVDREKNEVHLSANFPLAGKHFADCLGEKCGYEILLENYSKVLRIEALTMLDMVQTDILPAVSDYTAKLVRTAAEKKSLLGDAAGGYEYKTAARLSALTETASEDAAKLSDALLQAGELPSAQEAADFYQAEVFKDMAELRLAVDEMETLTSRACWPYPTYGELLFSVR